MEEKKNSKLFKGKNNEKDKVNKTPEIKNITIENKKLEPEDKDSIKSKDIEDTSKQRIENINKESKLFLSNAKPLKEIKVQLTSTMKIINSDLMTIKDKYDDLRETMKDEMKKEKEIDRNEKLKSELEEKKYTDIQEDFFRHLEIDSTNIVFRLMKLV